MLQLFGKNVLREIFNDVKTTLLVNKLSINVIFSSDIYPIFKIFFFQSVILSNV